MFELRPYRQQADSDAVYALWQKALGQLWPIAAANFHTLLTGSPLYREGDYFVACQADQIVGFVAAQLDRSDPEAASIAALFVDPQWQRRGIGASLHAAALAHLQASGATRVQLGCGYSYFWPGVPANLPAARPFFHAQGWNFDEPCYDLAQNMQEYHTPKDPPVDLVIELATAADAPELLEFERREFPHWLGPFQSTVDVGDFHDLLIVRDPTSRAIIGSLILYSPHAHPSRFDGFWKAILGDPLGEIGCVGVADARHGQGIGSALMVRASAILKQRGVASVHIGWVYRVNFYRRLGYDLWREYDMSGRDL
ncbi:MAG: GNAT family N-acetyltransferase [Chloroflexota bacterium]|nr:GNAT family N-acetyltransferase [Chloroflexota bacterium]